MGCIPFLYIFGATYPVRVRSSMSRESDISEDGVAVPVRGVAAPVTLSSAAALRWAGIADMLSAGVVMTDVEESTCSNFSKVEVLLKQAEISRQTTHDTAAHSTLRLCIRCLIHRHRNGNTTDWLVRVWLGCYERVWGNNIRDEAASIC